MTERRWVVGQVWQTSRGFLWHVMRVEHNGEAQLLCGRRQQFRRMVPSQWTLYEPEKP